MVVIIYLIIAAASLVVPAVLNASCAWYFIALSCATIPTLIVWYIQRAIIKRLRWNFYKDRLEIGAYKLLKELVRNPIGTKVLYGDEIKQRAEWIKEGIFLIDSITLKDLDSDVEYTIHVNPEVKDYLQGI